MAEKPQVLAAKVDRLLAILSDGQATKNADTVADARDRMQAAADEVRAATTVADVEGVTLPSERA